eukprot:364285-Chlamydomonas_euryale.AAC.3
MDTSTKYGGQFDTLEDLLKPYKKHLLQSAFDLQSRLKQQVRAAGKTRAVLLHAAHAMHAHVQTMHACIHDPEHAPGACTCVRTMHASEACTRVHACIRSMHPQHAHACMHASGACMHLDHAGGACAYVHTCMHPEHARIYMRAWCCACVVGMSMHEPYGHELLSPQPHLDEMQPAQPSSPLFNDHPRRAANASSIGQPALTRP